MTERRYRSTMLMYDFVVQIFADIFGLNRGYADG